MKKLLAVVVAALLSACESGQTRVTSYPNLKITVVQESDAKVQKRSKSGEAHCTTKTEAANADGEVWHTIYAAWGWLGWCVLHELCHADGGDEMPCRARAMPSNDN